MKETDQTPPPNYGSATYAKGPADEKSSSANSISELGPAKQDAAPVSQITRQKMVNTLIICLCQLLNFMDRYALPGKLHWILKISYHLIILI